MIYLNLKKGKIFNHCKPFIELYFRDFRLLSGLALFTFPSASLNVSSYPRCCLLTSIKILGLTVFVFCQRQQQMMTTLCPLGIDLKFSTASCHSPPLPVARCGSRQAARHAVWQDEKISHSLKSSAAATLQSLRNVPSLRTSLFLAFPFAPFPSRSPHRCLCPCPCPWPELVS